MKTAIAIIAAGLVSFGIAGNAYAASKYHLEPEGTTFTGTGTTSATKNGVTLQCKAKFQGHVDDTGVGFVDSGTFSGQVGCSTVGLSDLPWQSNALTAKAAQINNVTFTSPIGNCGPGNIKVGIKLGKIKFTNVPLTGGCTVTGAIKTSPALSIVHN
jgi:hypothetical protein